MGWIVHRAVDHFPDDAQDIPDQEWIEYGLCQGWTPLCKDGRIRGRDVERRPVEERAAVLFHLDNQRLLIDEMVMRFHRSQVAIVRAVRRGGPAIYAVGFNSIRRTWPVET